jgi:hypothetical protein
VGLCFVQSLVFCVALSWSLFAFFWPLCYLSFIDLLFLVTSLVSSKIPCTLYKHAINVLAYQIGNQKPKMCRAPLGVIQPKDLSMISKIDYDIADILLRLASNTNQSINQNRLWFHKLPNTFKSFGSPIF